MMPRRSSQPVDQLTRICDAMVTALHAHPEYDESIRCAIMLTSGKQGGLVIEGYDTDMQAVSEVSKHLENLAAGVKIIVRFPGEN